MQALQNIQALQDISKSSLPTRMIEEVFPIFEQQIQSNESIAIGVSSGVDSMCLANLLITRYYKKNYPIKHIHIIHCNHKIRPQSEQEEKYIQQFFKGTNIHIFHRNMEGKTDEKSLRNRRYECFNTILQEKNIPILFLGHHLEDRIESTFLNTIRGAGLKGFLNMQIIQKHHLVSNKKICRPLLNITKSEIINFCKKSNIGYFEDETNTDMLTSQRNYLRKEIIGKLLHIEGKPTKFLESMKNIYQQIATLPSQKKNHSITKNKADFQPIPSFPARESEFSYLWKKDLHSIQKKEIVELRDQLGIYYNITNAKIQERYQRIKKKQKGRKELKGIYFFLYEKKLYIIKAKKEFWKETNQEQNLITQLGIQTIAGMSIEANEKRFLGATLRFPKSGDTFNGKTRNRRALNQKIPVFWRNFIPLALKDGNIIHMRKDVYK